MDALPAVPPHLSDEVFRVCFLSDAKREEFELLLSTETGVGFNDEDYFVSCAACDRYFAIKCLRQFLQMPAAAIPDGAAPSRVEYFYHNEKLAAYGIQRSLENNAAPQDSTLARNAIFCVCDTVPHYVHACVAKGGSVLPALHDALVMRNIVNAPLLAGEADMLAGVVASIERSEHARVVALLAMYAREALPVVDARVGFAARDMLGALSARQSWPDIVAGLARAGMPHGTCVTRADADKCLETRNVTALYNGNVACGWGTVVAALVVHKYIIPCDDAADACIQTVFGLPPELLMTLRAHPRIATRLAD